jgi:proteasome lid subunit RPN8/RPN11
MKADLAVVVDAELLEAVLEGARRLHPRETILLLRGKKSKGVIRVSELVVPPLATYGRGFAGIRVHMLPMDFSIVGTVHSHPSGNLKPSATDLNHFFGTVLMIVGFPYESLENVALYNHDGERLAIEIVEP